jgi:ATP-dependent RNA helicase RhlE
MSFEDLRLDEPLLRAVRAAGYRSPTPIQTDAIPVVLAGRDVLGCAQTGTGKTAAFALPILQHLSKAPAGKRTAPVNGRASEHPMRTADRRRKGRSSRRPKGAVSTRPIRSLVLCPTRELCQQIRDSFVTYGAHTGFRTTAVFGGVSQTPQVRSIQAGADIVVATPGRLIDLMGQGFVNLANVEILVLDEADRMLDMGFMPDIRRILPKLPRQRQSLMFSATIPPPIRKLAADILHDPVPVQVARVSSPPSTVSHSVYHVERSKKVSLLVHLLKDSPADRVLVFSRTKRGADRLTQRLVRADVPAAAMHGDKSQFARTRALAEFRSARTPVLVATDLAARGLDVDDIALVVNFDLTAEPETYVHRIGRTGRAGASGAAVSFCTDQDREDLRAIEKLLRVPLQRVAVPPLSGGGMKQKPHSNPEAEGDSGAPRRPVGNRPTSRNGSRRSVRRRRRRSAPGRVAMANS